MDFSTAAKLGNYLSKDYAESFFKLLATYRDISASEAASRLKLHINTAQEFLEAMTALDVVSRKEVYEGKRPYFRYSLQVSRITMDLDLSALAGTQAPEGRAKKIREAKNANVRFTTGRGGQSISSITIWSGKGRDRNEQRINLTAAQGSFLYHLPFPDGESLSQQEIMKKAGIDASFFAEIADIVKLLVTHDALEMSE